MISTDFPEFSRCTEWSSTGFAGETPDAHPLEMLAYFGNLATAKKLKPKHKWGFSVIYV
jgi:hypothetical protein